MNICTNRAALSKHLYAPLCQVRVLAQFCAAIRHVRLACGVQTIRRGITILLPTPDLLATQSSRPVLFSGSVELANRRAESPKPADGIGHLLTADSICVHQRESAVNRIRGA